MSRVAPNPFRFRPTLTELDRRDMPGSLLDWLLAEAVRPAAHGERG